MARLKEHEAELKQLGVEHLYLFGSTARDEAREDSDVDLFFDHPEGSLGLFKLMEVKEIAADILGVQDRHHDPAESASVSAASDRSLRAAGVLMASRTVAARLLDIIEAIAHVAARPQVFRSKCSRRIGASAGWSSVASKSSPRLAATSPDELKARHRDIPWRRIAGVGNVLRHEYDRVAADVLWALVRDDLPSLDGSAARSWSPNRLASSVTARPRRAIATRAFWR